jgi:hypothetical protein
LFRKLCWGWVIAGDASTCVRILNALVRFSPTRGELALFNSTETLVYGAGLPDIPTASFDAA